MDEQQRSKPGSGEHPAVQTLKNMLGEYTRTQPQALREVRRRASERMQEVEPEAASFKKKEAT